MVELEKSRDLVENNLNPNLGGLESRLNKRKLLSSWNKTAYMHVSNTWSPPNLTLWLNYFQLELVKSNKHLGLTSGENLIRADHGSYV